MDVPHSRLGEPGPALSCYRQGPALVRGLKNPLARWMLASMLAEFGDACQATGDLPAAVEAWQQASQVLDDRGWPDLLGVASGSSRQASPARQADDQAPTPAFRRTPAASCRFPDRGTRPALATASS